MTHSWVNFPGVLDDDRNGQVDIVRVHQAHSEACEARKGPMHRPLSQHLQQQQLLQLPVLSVEPGYILCTISVPAAAHSTATHCCTLQILLRLHFASLHSVQEADPTILCNTFQAVLGLCRPDCKRFIAGKCCPHGLWIRTLQ